MYSLRPLHTDEKVLRNKLESIYNGSVLDVSRKTCRKRLTIETNGGRGLGKSKLGARHGNGDDDDMYISFWSNPAE